MKKRLRSQPQHYFAFNSSAAMIHSARPALVVLWLAICSPVAAQPALERLERQLQTPAAQPPRGGNGYLGLVTKANDAGGGFIRVVEVVPGGPAALAGLQADDVILSVDGRLTRQMDDLAAALEGRSPGDRITLAILRGQQQREVPLTLGRRSATTEGPALLPPPGGLPSGDSAREAAAQRPVTPVEPLASPPQADSRTLEGRIDLLERRVAELERRLAELERLLRNRP